MATMMKKASASVAATRSALPLRAAVRPAALSRRAVAVRAHHAPPLVGSHAPDFKAQAVYDQEFVEVSLSKYRGKYVVLFF